MEANVCWIDEVSARLKRKNQTLFVKDSAYLQDLILLFRGQDHRVMVLWAFDVASESIAQLGENILRKSGLQKRWKPPGHGPQGM